VGDALTEEEGEGKWTLALVAFALAAFACATSVLANGNEALGLSSVHVAGGAGIAATGTGMSTSPNSANSFGVSVPSGVTLKPVLLY
jgi:hypothetical protein